MSADILDFDWINSLGQLYANIFGTWWPVHDIEVQTCLMRIDVCGLLEVKDLHDARRFTNDDGQEFEVDDFYLDGYRAIMAKSKMSRNKREGRFSGKRWCEEVKKLTRTGHNPHNQWLALRVDRTVVEF